jgi:hypothetical protein
MPRACVHSYLRAQFLRALTVARSPAAFGTWTKAVASTKRRRFQCSGRVAGMGDGDETAPGDEPPAEDQSQKYNMDFVARFAGTAFGSEAFFSRTVFNGEADFTGMPTERWSATFGALLSRTHEEAFIELTHRHEESWKRHGSGPDRFLAIRFSGARFDREASFLDRSFEKSADFSGARFYYAPEIDWTGNFTKFVPISGLTAPTNQIALPKANFPLYCKLCGRPPKRQETTILSVKPNLEPIGMSGLKICERIDGKIGQAIY